MFRMHKGTSLTPRKWTFTPNLVQTVVQCMHSLFFFFSDKHFYERLKDPGIGLKMFLNPIHLDISSSTYFLKYSHNWSDPKRRSSWNWTLEFGQKSDSIGIKEEYHGAGQVAFCTGWAEAAVSLALHGWPVCLLGAALGVGVPDCSHIENFF